MSTVDTVKQEIVDFMQDFTIETTPGSAAKIADYREHLRPGTLVAVTFLPGSDFADTVKVAQRLRDEGFEPAPHFAARSVPSKEAFEDYVKQVTQEAGVTHVVALAGGVGNPVGPFESSMELLETGVFDRNGITSIGVAGHPEGSPDISDEDIAAALKWKNSFAKRTDAKVYICTQFCFESDPIIAWDRMIQAEGNRLPIHLGVPGLATLKTLINFAKSSGVGNSIRFLTKQARQVTRLLTVNAPDQLVRELARHRAHHPDCGITQVHMYPLGGMRRSAAWSYAVLDGEFELTAKGFKLTRDIG
ncbi:MAG: methylenetetrahydrofolate reductase [Rhodospirillales bacterium]|nr:methylenetetrahydrofolate reductase [Rhodospirillales bacterium]